MLFSNFELNKAISQEMKVVPVHNEFFFVVISHSNNAYLNMVKF